MTHGAMIAMAAAGQAAAAERRVIDAFHLDEAALIARRQRKPASVVLIVAYVALVALLLVLLAILLVRAD
jgi:hypothetical protein